MVLEIPCCFRWAAIYGVTVHPILISRMEMSAVGVPLVTLMLDWSIVCTFSNSQGRSHDGAQFELLPHNATWLYPTKLQTLSLFLIARVRSSLKSGYDESHGESSSHCQIVVNLKPFTWAMPPVSS